MKPTRERRYFTRSPSPRSTRLEPSTSIRPAVGRSIPPRRFSRVVFPHPEGPWTATSSPSATLMSRPRRAITSDRPARYTFIRSFVTMFGMSSSTEFQDLGEVDVGCAHRDEQRRQEHRGGRAEHEEERGPREHEEIRDRRRRDPGRSRREPVRREERGAQPHPHYDSESDENDDERLSDVEMSGMESACTAEDF